MPGRVRSLAGIILSLALLAAGLALLYSASHSLRVPLRLAGRALVAQGIVMEKITEQHPDRLLPFDVTSYVVRYAFPNAQGQMRTGQQTVTKSFFEELPGQGSPAWVFFDPDDPSVSAIDPRLTFPGAAGWRLGMAAAALLLAALLLALNAGLAGRRAGR